MIHSVILATIPLYSQHIDLQLPTIAVSRIRRHRNGFPSIPVFSVNRFVAPLV